MKVSVHMRGRQALLGGLTVATWGGALVMAALLAWRTHRLEQHMEELNKSSGEMVKSAEELRQSTERLEDSVHRFIERYQEAQKASPLGPPSASAP